MRDGMENLPQVEYIQRLQAAMREKHCAEKEIQGCVQYAERLVSAGLPVLFDGAHVEHVLRLHKVKMEEYHVFYLPQGDKKREITAPSQALKARQRWVLDTILSRLEVSPHAHGFEANHSIKTNALLHAEHDYVLCLDIQDYFPSISQGTVLQVFRKAGYSQSAAEKLAALCCYEDALPQGAPTSPRLSNLIFREIDGQLAETAARFDAVYSRYADDLTFSADHALGEIAGAVSALLEENGFQLNPQKTKAYGPGRPKEITGLIVQNGMVRVPKAYKRTLRQEIYYCKKFGVLVHLENRKDTRYINYREHLYGKAYYVHMIEPEQGERYLKELDQIHWPPYA